MRKTLNQIGLVALASLAISTSTAHATDVVQNATENALNYMHSVYQTTYAPAPWKEQYDNWNLDREYTAAVGQSKSKGPDLSVFDAREIIKGFIYSMRDYHVSVRFIATEKATLPLSVRSAEGRYFIVNIDRERLGEDLFPFQVGDEVVTFDGRPVADVVSELRADFKENVPTTDQARAEMILTARTAARGSLVPQGPVTLGVKAKGSETVSERQLIWEYTKEDVPPYHSPFRKLEPISKPAKEQLVRRFMMSADIDTDAANPHAMGAKKSFLPTLGEVVWEADEKESFNAYIYRDENKSLVGVVRIPSYFFESDDNKVYADAVESFSRIINKMEKLTDKLVIDQLNNPGGSVFYLYALASTLSPQPLRTPRHMMSVTPTEVRECANTLKQIESFKTDEDARIALGETIHGYPVNLQTVEFYRGYCRLYLEEWSNSKTMTRPFWIAGVDKINPYPKGTYSKPITILVNELDFSGGDFFPTIMQDNKRAKIFGVRTAGAGGYVNEFQFPNLLGVDVFRVTQSLAYRVDNTTIENLGVTPDVVYEMKASDRQNNYSDYVTAVKAAIK